MVWCCRCRRSWLQKRGCLFWRGPRSSACPAPGSGCLFFLCPSKHTGGITLPPLVFHSPYPEPYVLDPSFDACLCVPLFSSVAQSCLTLCKPMACSTPGLPVHHQLPELAQTHVLRVGDAIQSSHPLSSPSPPAFSLSQDQSLLQVVSSSHQMAKVLEFQLQHQSFQ